MTKNSQDESQKNTQDESQKKAKPKFNPEKIMERFKNVSQTMNINDDPKVQNLKNNIDTAIENYSKASDKDAKKTIAKELAKTTKEFVTNPEIKDHDNLKKDLKGIFTKKMMTVGKDLKIKKIKVQTNEKGKKIVNVQGKVRKAPQGRSI